MPAEAILEKTADLSFLAEAAQLLGVEPTTAFIVIAAAAVAKVGLLVWGVSFWATSKANRQSDTRKLVVAAMGDGNGCAGRFETRLEGVEEATRKNTETLIRHDEADKKLNRAVRWLVINHEKGDEATADAILGKDA